MTKAKFHLRKGSGKDKNKYASMNIPATIRDWLIKNGVEHKSELVIKTVDGKNGPFLFIFRSEKEADETLKKFTTPSISKGVVGSLGTLVITA